MHYFSPHSYSHSGIDHSCKETIILVKTMLYFFLPEMCSMGSNYMTSCLTLRYKCDLGVSTAKSLFLVAWVQLASLFFVVLVEGVWTAGWNVNTDNVTVRGLIGCINKKTTSVVGVICTISVFTAAVQFQFQNKFHIFINMKAIELLSCVSIFQ